MVSPHFWDDDYTELSDLSSFSPSSFQDHIASNFDLDLYDQDSHHDLQHPSLLTFDYASESESQSERSSSSSSIDSNHQHHRRNATMPRLPHHPFVDARHPPSFRHVTLNMPTHRADALGMRNDDILILPAVHPMRLKIHIRKNHHSVRTLRTLVATDMKLSDVVREVLPDQSHRETQVFIKWNGGWVDPGEGVSVRGLMEQGIRDVEVRIQGRERNAPFLFVGEGPVNFFRL